jgi:hypothetical protein
MMSFYSVTERTETSILIVFRIQVFSHLHRKQILKLIPLLRG